MKACFKIYLGAMIIAIAMFVVYCGDDGDGNPSGNKFVSDNPDSSHLEIVRDVPVDNVEEEVVVAPERSVATLVAAPNPASRSGAPVTFFVNGVDGNVTGNLRIHDAIGNVIKTVGAADGWNFTDARNRLVATGTYFVSGDLVINGSTTSISTYVGVTR